MTYFAMPTPEQIEAAIPLLSSPAHEAYFFNKLENPNWIVPLNKRGMFDHPPRSKDERGAAIPHQRWPQSQYLARMAKWLPVEAVGVLETLPADNPWIILDMVKAAIVMPGDIAVKLVPQIESAANAGLMSIFFEDVAELCAHLIQADQHDGATRLVRALFAITSEAPESSPGRWNEYRYKEGLNSVAPLIAERWPIEFVPELMGWLACAIQWKHRIDSDGQSDASYFWRPAIEEHEQNSDFEFAGYLVGVLRKVLEIAIQSRKLSLHKSLTILQASQLLVFRRIELHLINEFAMEDVELVRKSIMDRKLSDDFKFKHEYAMLVGRQFGVLSSHDRDTWLGWVHAGPDLTDYDEWMRLREMRAPTDDERKARSDYWKFERLHWIRDHLADSDASFYSQMLSKEGIPRLADVNVTRCVSRWSGESPFSSDTFKHLEFEDVVALVSSWKPDTQWIDGPDAESLARTFQRYVSEQVESRSKHAHLMMGRPIRFIDAFVDAMAEGAKAGRELDLSGILDLCLYLIQQTEPVGETVLQGSNQWARESVSTLVRNICSSTADDCLRYLVPHLRQKIWQVIRSLYRDPPRSHIQEQTQSQDPRTHDYLDHGINSARGKAVEAGLAYARWLLKQNEVGVTDSAGFESMPEVREMIEWQIAPENRSIEALSVLGSEIGLICWIDKKWLAANASLLFDLEGIENSPPSTEGWAAWNAFLVWCSPHVEFYNLFEKQFIYAVKQSPFAPSGGSRERPMEHMGEHLIILYGRGRLTLDAGGVMRQFLAETLPEIRQHAIGFVGRTMPGDEPVPNVVIERFMELWGVYWPGRGKLDARERPESLSFGTWFSSGKFPIGWALSQLEDFVAVAPSPAPDNIVVEQLAKVVNEDVSTCIRILDRMIRGDRDGWRIMGWKESATVIVRSAMNAGGNARKTAIELIDYLGRRGFMEFGELLNF